MNNSKNLLRVKELLLKRAERQRTSDKPKTEDEKY